MAVVIDDVDAIVVDDADQLQGQQQRGEQSLIGRFKRARQGLDDLSVEVTAVQARSAQLETQNSALHARLGQLEKQNQALQARLGQLEKQNQALLQQVQPLQDSATQLKLVQLVQRASIGVWPADPADMSTLTVQHVQLICNSGMVDSRRAGEMLLTWAGAQVSKLDVFKQLNLLLKKEGIDNRPWVSWGTATLLHADLQEFGKALVEHVADEGQLISGKWFEVLQQLMPAGAVTGPFKPRLEGVMEDVWRDHKAAAGHVRWFAKAVGDENLHSLPECLAYAAGQLDQHAGDGNGSYADALRSVCAAMLRSG